MSDTENLMPTYNNLVLFCNQIRLKYLELLTHSNTVYW